MNENKKISFEERKKQSNKIIDKYKDKYPIYLTFDNNIDIDITKVDINLNKYIVSSELTLGQFLAIIRKKINFNSNESLTLFIEEYVKDYFKSAILCLNSSTIREIYNKHKDPDGFLYIKVVKENSFG
jgi:GABA(A) receptor-associated protein